MKTFKTSLVLLLALVFTFAVAETRLAAAEYYVATSGDDGNNGTRSHPWKTINRGISELQPGDTLTILPGEYYESVSASLSGLPGKPITLQAAEVGTVLIRGDRDLPPDTFQQEPGHDYVWSVPFSTEVQGVAEQYARTLYQPVFSMREVNDYPASYFHDAETRKLYLHTSDSKAPGHHHLSALVATEHGLYLRPPEGESAVSDVVITGLSFRGFTSRESTTGGYKTRWGIWITGPQRCIVRQCSAYFNGGGIGFIRPVNDSIIERCLAFANHSPNSSEGGNIIVYTPAKNTILRNNVSHSTPAAGLRFYGRDAIDCVVESNLTWDCERGGIWIKGGDTSTSKILRNVSFDGITPYGATTLFNLSGVIHPTGPTADHASNIRYDRLRDPDKHFISAENHDYRLQESSSLRGSSPDGEDPGPGKLDLAGVPDDPSRTVWEPNTAQPAIEHIQATRTATTINLRWKLIGKPAATVLRWGSTPTGESTELLPDDGTVSRTISFTGLSPGTTYYFSLAPAQSGSARPFGELRQQLEVVTLEKELPAKTYHVSPNGNDQHDGLSPQRAWKTLAHAAEKVLAGDTVLVTGGVYKERIPVLASGDQGRPITFRAEGRETVWIEGSDQLRKEGFTLSFNHHVVLDGLSFREFQMEGAAVRINGGSHITVTRCFYDGRSRVHPPVYPPPFIRASRCSNLEMNNCVMVRGWGNATFDNCPDLVIRNNVFYHGMIRALSIINRETSATVSHNLFCDLGPTKVRSKDYQNSLLLITNPQNYRGDYNVFFVRLPVEERQLVESIPKQGPRPRRVLAEIREEIGQEKHSVFGNPGIGIIDAMELAPSSGHIQKELHLKGREPLPMDFSQFVIPTSNPLAVAGDGKPVGLEPQLIR